jgi:hypothetical protein
MPPLPGVERPGAGERLLQRFVVELLKNPFFLRIRQGNELLDGGFF